MMDPYDEPHSGFWRPTTIGAGVVLLIVLLLLGFVFFGNGNGKSGHSAASQPSSAPNASSTAGGARSTTTARTTSSRCSLTAGNQAIPEVTPQGITWKLYQTVALPYSATAGPQIVNGDIARCYAHSPLGALIAASQIQARYLIAPDWRAVVAEQVMPGPGRSVYVTNRAKAGNPGGNQPGDYNQLAGFKFVTYSPAVAVIEFVSQATGGAMQAITATVDWSGGDWKLRLQPDGGESPNALPVTSLVGFSTWSGV